MAIIKFIGAIHPRKGNRYAGLKNCVAYIQNPKKTEQGTLIGYQNCSMFSPVEDMITTMESFGKITFSPRCRLGYHFTISFPPTSQTDKKQALEMAEEFCSIYLKDYEVVYTVHTDQEHLHVHICFNATSYKTGKKYHYTDGDWAKAVQPLLDQICKKHGCHTLEEDTKISLAEYEKERKQRKRKPAAKESHSNCTYERETSKQMYSRSQRIYNDIDECILLSNSFAEFLKHMQERGYFIKQGNVKHMAIKHVTDRRYRRLDTLDKTGYYSEEGIKKRIAQSHKPMVSVPINLEYRFIVPPSHRMLRLPKKKLTSYEKRYYARMYQLGKKKRTEWVRVQEIRQAMKEIDDLAEKIHILNQVEEKGMQAYQKEQEEVYQALEQKQKAYRLDQKNNRKFFQTVKKIQTLKMAHDLWKMGDGSYEKEYTEYETCKMVLNAYGYTPEAAQRYYEQRKEEQKELRKQIKKSKQHLDLLAHVKEDLTKTFPQNSEHALFESYLELKAQDRQEQEKERQRNKKIRK